MDGGIGLGSFRVIDLKGLLGEVNQVFDAIRIIEPIKRQVVHQEGDESIVNKSTCYEFWETGIMCEECGLDYIRIGQETLLKIQESNNRKLIVIESPFIFGDNKYILEMTQDITKSGES